VFEEQSLHLGTIGNPGALCFEYVILIPTWEWRVLSLPSTQLRRSRAPRVSTSWRWLGESVMASGSWSPRHSSSKYNQYEKAVTLALEQTPEDKESVVMVVGAGRGTSCVALFVPP
jgi:hypothetical protein